MPTGALAVAADITAMYGAVTHLLDVLHVKMNQPMGTSRVQHGWEEVIVVCAPLPGHGRFRPHSTRLVRATPP